MESCLTHALLESFVGSEMPVSSCSGEVCAGRAGRRMVWARSLPHSGTAALAYVWAAWRHGSWHRSPSSLHTHGAVVIFLYLPITHANTWKKCYVYLKTFSSYVKMRYVFFWIHIKIHNYQSKKKKNACHHHHEYYFSHRYLEVLGTKITGMMPVEHSVIWWKIKNLANIERDACYSHLQVSVLTLMMETGTGEMFGASLSTFSHTIRSNKEHFLRLTGVQVRCFLVLPSVFRMQVLLPR